MTGSFGMVGGMTNDPDFDYELTKTKEGKLELARRYEERAKTADPYRRERLLQEVHSLRASAERDFY